MKRARGFTLIEVMTALLVLSLLALMSYRGLGAVLDAREHVKQETDKWRHVAAFFARFERDVELAAPRPVRTAGGLAPAWLGVPTLSTSTGMSEAATTANLEFSRFASTEGIDTARRIGYRMNDKNEIELWLWPGLDVAPGRLPQRYPVLTGVKSFELQYLDRALAWVDAWPVSAADLPLPRAVRLRVVLASNEEIVRVFVLRS
ncbi:MAG: type II secretion system minor pseudopilin GspJ [Burkholderiales bacterium]|nr:type II secretion system minor pseudopilin GspJ [Burkholderiales bacterium]